MNYRTPADVEHEDAISAAAKQATKEIPMKSEDKVLFAVIVAVALIVLAITGAILTSSITEDRNKTSSQRCSESCGNKRMSSWTRDVNGETCLCKSLKSDGDF